MVVRVRMEKGVEGGGRGGMGGGGRSDEEQFN